MRKRKIGDTVIDWIGAAECWGFSFLRLLGLVIAAFGAGDDVFGGKEGKEGRLVRWDDEDGKG